MRQLLKERAVKVLFIVCSFSILPLPTSTNQICCTSDRGKYELDNTAKSFEEAKKCDQVTNLYRYLKDKDAKGKNQGKRLFKSCNVCILHVKPWTNTVAAAAGKYKRISQSCGAEESIEDFKDEYGGVNKCKFHPSPNTADAVVKCACEGEKCNKMTNFLAIPNEKWAAKMEDKKLCGDNKYAKLTYKPFDTRTSQITQVATDCLTEEKIKGDLMVVGSCVALYRVTADDVKTADAILVTCVSDGPRKIEEWSAKFPNRVWEYQTKEVVKPTDPTDPKEPNGSKKPNGATDIFVSFAANMLVFATTVLIAY